jgi:hypothetical protein
MAQRKRNPGAIRDLESIVNPGTGDITTTGNATVNNLTVCGDASVEGNLTVSGSITMQGVQLRHPVQFGPVLLVSGSAAIPLITGLPTWQSRIDMTVINMSTNGAAAPILQLGTLTGLVTAGYVGSAVRTTDASSNVGSMHAAGFRLNANPHTAAQNIMGHIALQKHGTATSNTWEFTFLSARDDQASTIQAGGYVTLPGPLTGLSVRTTTGTATEGYDNGEIAGRYIY